MEFEKFISRNNIDVSQKFICIINDTAIELKSLDIKLLRLLRRGQSISLICENIDMSRVYLFKSLCSLRTKLAVKTNEEVLNKLYRENPQVFPKI